MKRTAITELRNVWGRVGLGSAPAPDETKNTLQAAGRRTKSDRTAQLNLRIRPDEKQEIALIALTEKVTINEIFSRMLALYQREHGCVELAIRDEGDAAPIPMPSSIARALAWPRSSATSGMRWPRTATA
jgi:hypothetical protein